MEEDLTPSNTNDPTLETDYHYNLEGNLVRTELPSGNIEAIDYDSLGRVIGMTDYDSKGTETVADDTKMAEYDYTLRADGRKVQSVEKFWKGSDANPFVTNTLSYDYDGLNRLTRETLDSTDNALDYRDDYVFDLTGNRLQKKHDVGIDGTIDSTTTSSFDANDRLLSEIIDQLTGTDSLNTYGYTQTQQTLKTSYTGTTAIAANRLSAMSFEYDLQGRLKTATTNTYTSGSVTRVERTSYHYWK